MTNFNKAEEAAFEADKARQGRMEARERGQEDHLVQEGEFDGTSMARNTFKVSCKCEFHVLCTYLHKRYPSPARNGDRLNHKCLKGAFKDTIGCAKLLFGDLLRFVMMHRFLGPAS